MTILESRRTGTLSAIIEHNSSKPIHPGTLSAIIEHNSSQSSHCYVSEVELKTVGGDFEVMVKLLNPLWTPLTAQEVLQVARWILIHDGVEFDPSQVVEEKGPEVLIQTYRVRITSEHTQLSSTP
jgi:hypothetical protein